MNVYGYRSVLILLCFIIKHFIVSFVEKNHQEYAWTLTFSHNTKENIECPARFFANDWFLILPQMGRENGAVIFYMTLHQT